MQSDNKKIFEVRNAISRGDVEYLFSEYKKALAERSGKEIIELINDNIEQVARIQKLPRPSSFRELMHSYDLREYGKLVEKGEFGRLGELIRDLRGLRTARLVTEAINNTADFPLPSQKEMAFFLVELAKKLGKFDLLDQLILSYKGQKQGEMESDSLFSVSDLLIKEIAHLLQKENNPKAEEVFREIFTSWGKLQTFDNYLENTHPSTMQNVPKWDLFNDISLDEDGSDEFYGFA